MPIIDNKNNKKDIQDSDQEEVPERFLINNIVILKK